MTNIYRGSTVPGTGSTARGNAGDIDIEDTGNLLDATEVEGALQELATELDTAEAAIVVNSDGLATHIADTSDAHAATAITNTPAGDIAATTVQAAIDELDTEKEPADATILKDADIGSTVQGYDADIPTVAASQAEMEAGTETANRTMNPEGVKQAIDALGGTIADGSITAAKLSTSQFGGDYIKLSDVKATTVNGGSSIAGTQIRVLNTEDSDSSGICTLSSNQFTLNTGTYRIKVLAPCHRADKHKAFLYNVSDTSIEIIGIVSRAYQAGLIATSAAVSGEFTIASSKIFEIRHYTETAQATNGLGLSVGDGTSEVYTVVELWRVK